MKPKKALFFKSKLCKKPQFKKQKEKELGNQKKIEFLNSQIFALKFQINEKNDKIASLELLFSSSDSNFVKLKQENFELSDSFSKIIRSPDYNDIKYDGKLKRKNWVSRLII